MFEKKERALHKALSALRKKEHIEHERLLNVLQDLHHTREHLRTEHALLHAVLESTADAILVVDTKGTLLHQNAHMKMLWKSALEKKHPLKSIAKLLKHPEQLYAHIRKYARSPLSGSDRLLLKDGRVIEAHSRPLVINKKSVGRVWSFRDVTELETYRQQLEKLVHEQTRELRKQNLLIVHSSIELVEAKKVVEDQNIESMSLASHEMKTPLTSIMALVELMLQRKIGPITARQQESLNIVYEDAKRLNMVVKNMGDVARIEENRIIYEFTDFDVIEFIKETIKISEVVLKQRNIQAILEQNSPIMVTADRLRLGQVIQNLITNAIKYGNENGHIWISAKRENNHILISIKDDGIGIAQENIPKLFTKRFQVDPSANRILGGLGLGLYICKRIIERHLGDISVKSKSNEGSTFTISLPILNKKFK